MILLARRLGFILAATMGTALLLSPAMAEAQTAKAVTIADFDFTPASLSIPAGTSVTWTNNGPTAHTATDQGVFDSGVLQKGQTFSFTFKTPGTFNYICSIHPFMKAAINVTAAAPAASPSAAATTASPAASVAPAQPASPRPSSASPAAAPKPSSSTGASQATSPAQAPAAPPRTGGGAGSAAQAPWWLAVLVLAAGVAVLAARARSLKR